MNITSTITRDGDTFIILQSANGQIALNAACAEAFAEGDTDQAKNVIRTTKYLKEISNRTLTEAEANEALAVAAASLSVQEAEEVTKVEAESENDAEVETQSEILEGEYQDAIQNDTVRECENSVEFENWAQNDWGFCEYNGTSYAKVDLRDVGRDVETFSRNDSTRTWSQWS